MVYDGFFDAVEDSSGNPDRSYNSEPFTGYFEQIVGTGVCVYKNADSMLVRYENGSAIVSQGYLFIQGYWLKNDADYSIQLNGSGVYAILAHLNLSNRMIELIAQPKATPEIYPDAVVLAYVTANYAGEGTVEDTRYNTDICGVVDAMSELSDKVAYAINYIDTQIDTKLQQAENDIATQSAMLDATIAKVAAEVEKLEPPPIGSIKFSASQNVGTEWLRCDGSFINEADYPELVTALGKLTPSGDKFTLISDGKIPPQITNGVIYGGRMWVYSYSARKLYGIDLAGTAAIKEMPVTSNDARFSNFITPSTAKPLCLSIVPHTSGNGAKLFLSQIIRDGETTAGNYAYMDYLLILCAEFTGTETTIPLQLPPFSSIQAAFVNPSGTTYELAAQIDNKSSLPYITSFTKSGIEKYYCATGYGRQFFSYITWDETSENAETNARYVGNATDGRSFFGRKNHGECIVLSHSGNSMRKWYDICSLPNYIVNTSHDIDREPNIVRTVSGPVNIWGTNAVVYDMVLQQFPYYSISDSNYVPVDVELHLPNAARIFVDAGAYLWGKDIYMVFVGTGIIFFRDLNSKSFGYLDTTDILGIITQFGYLDYSEDEGTLYIVGQDSENNVKAAKIVLNTLYDYANDGAWLPLIASDGVPAYIKAKEA